MKILQEARESLLPRDFVESHYRQSKIIKWLLKHNPEERPNANELLKSELFPTKLEDEQLQDALKIVKKPHTR